MLRQGRKESVNLLTKYYMKMVVDLILETFIVLILCYSMR